jgi:predicted outer membrane protein
MRRARFFARWALAATGIVSLHLGLVGCGVDSLAGSSPRESTDAGGTVDSGEAIDASRAIEAGAIDAGCGGPLFAVCSDGQILAILAAEFSARVNLASAVRASLGSTSALDLAEKILTDDAVLGVEVQGEMRETAIASAPGGVDQEISQEAQWVSQALGAERAPAVDAAYIDEEVLAHLRAIALIDRLLGPSVHDPRIGDLLARARDLVVQHAQAAIQAQSELEGPCAAGKKD